MVYVIRVRVWRENEYPETMTEEERNNPDCEMCYMDGGNCEKECQTID